MNTISNLHNEVELKQLFKQCMTNYVTAIDKKYGQEDIYVIVFGTDVKTMFDKFTCLAAFNTEKAFERTKQTEDWLEYFEGEENELDEEEKNERFWYFRLNEHEWEETPEFEYCEDIFNPVKDYLTNYFAADLEDEDFETNLLDAEILNAASFAFAELREEGLLKNRYGKEIIIAFIGFDRSIKVNNYVEIFERAHKNVPNKDEYLGGLIENGIGY